MDENDNETPIHPYQTVFMGHPSDNTNVIMQQTNVLCSNCGHHVFTTIMPVIPTQRLYHQPAPVQTPPQDVPQDTPQVPQLLQRKRKAKIVEASDDDDDDDEDDDFVVGDDVEEYEDDEEEKEKKKKKRAPRRKRSVPRPAPSASSATSSDERFGYATRYHKAISDKLNNERVIGNYSWDDIAQYEEDVWRRDFHETIMRGFYRRLIRPQLMKMLEEIGNQCHAKTMHFQRAFPCVMESILDVRLADYGTSISNECYACGKAGIKHYVDWEIWDDEAQKGYPMRLGRCCEPRVTAILAVTNALWEDGPGVYNYSIFKHTKRATSVQGKNHLYDLLGTAKVIMHRVATNKRRIVDDD